MFWQSNDVEVLISKKKYGKAIKLLREQLNHERNVFKMQQLADLLALEGDKSEAVKILTRLVEEFAAQGFMTKAIAILKKIQRIKPDLQGLEEKITELIRCRERDEAGEAGEQPEAEGLPLADSDGDEGGVAAIPINQDEDPAVSGLTSSMDATPSSRLAESGSPLFRGFSDEELTAFIRGLDLIICEPGQILFSEGEPGNSLYVLASGLLRVYVRNREGRNEQIRLMGTGEFFGEISLLSGQARTATITAASHCEMLKLDMARLKELAKKHPAMPEVIREFARLRYNSPEEKKARES